MRVCIIINARVMPLMKERRDEQMLKGAKGPAHVRVNQQRRSANQDIGRNHGGDRKSDQEEGGAHHRGVHRLTHGVQP